MDNLRLPAKPNSFKLRRYEECRDACLNDCSCTAYSYDNVCSIWNGGIRNLQQLHEGDNGGRTIYLRLAASDLPSSSGSGAKVIKVVLSSVAGVVAILFIAYCLKNVHERTKRAQTLRKLDNSLVQFSYTDLQRITRNFSEKLGSGGFGSVFKGTLPNSIQVAVKKLEGLRQGEKQFRAEVSTLGVIQHVNLVRLYGFCSGGNKRLLVYEYMPKGSLDAHLFLNESTELDWELRFQIILGTARGLAYLHEECRECIVHCDVKPDNVLLDAEFNPKVSDFGMAKLIGRTSAKC
ncbi:hypothetical protein HPP92_011992 [Vanilla planifolia]|uniref:non-specific serine/threonine protein kinase n=1 Tax=Vanilla planifolia TaxID=51239 RepID=A0A835V412_VANPL|nr:hypothetical protein HPP92_011992 [Vanilla planifolia]